MKIENGNYSAPSFKRLFVKDAARRIFNEADKLTKAMPGRYSGEYKDLKVTKPLWSTLMEIVEKRQQNNKFHILVDEAKEDGKKAFSDAGEELLGITTLDKKKNEILKRIVNPFLKLGEKKNEAVKETNAASDFKTNWFNQPSRYEYNSWCNPTTTTTTTAKKELRGKIESPVYDAMKKAEDEVNLLNFEDIKAFESKKTREKKLKNKQTNKKPAEKSFDIKARVEELKEKGIYVPYTAPGPPQPLQKSAKEKIPRSVKKELKQKNITEPSNDSKPTKKSVRYPINSIASKPYVEETRVTAKEQYRAKKAVKIAERVARKAERE